MMLARIPTRQGQNLRRSHPLAFAKAAVARRPYTFDSLLSGSGGGGGGGGYGGGGMGIYLWPRTTVNTGLCVCPEGERMVVERFGKMVDIKSPG
jgi:hypothetical protein